MTPFATLIDMYDRGDGNSIAMTIRAHQHSQARVSCVGFNHQGVRPLVILKVSSARFVCSLPIRPVSVFMPSRVYHWFL